jgi:CheY-like chemotaxis protein
VSLSGAIEDLPLLEILQVVSFCQKTGFLTVTTPEGEAGVVFRGGQIVSGYAWDLAPFAFEGAEGPARSEALRARLSALLGRLVRLREGEFAFNLSDEVPTRLGGRDLSGETLADGINPEGLMLDLARKLDEDRRDCAAVLEASFVAAPAAAPEPDEIAPEDLALEELPAGGPATVLLVDDEADVRRVVAARVAARGYEVVAAGTPEEARREMGRIAALGRPLLMVVDLGLPSQSGASFRGGLDVARHAAGIVPAPGVLLMAEAVDERLRARARRLGVSMLAFKPGLSKLDPLQYEADLRAFGDKLARDLLPRLEGRRRPSAPGPRPAAPPAPASADADLATAREETLRAALEEVESHPDPDLVAFLLLRAARAFFPRAVLFVAKDERLRGLSGFGPAEGGASLDLAARDLSVPLAPGSTFGQALALGRHWRGPIPADAGLCALLDRIGRFSAREAAIVPLRAMHETIAVVYGDAPDGAALPDVGAFASFVERAGRALEDTLAARREALAATG